MALPVIADVFRVALRWDSTQVSTNAVNVMHFLSVGSTPTNVYTFLNANATANMWAHTGSGSTVPIVDVTELDGTSATQSFVTGSPAKWTGAAGAGDCIPAACALVKIQTVLRGREHRGRVYLPTVLEGVQTNGVIGAGTVTTMQTAWNTFLTAMAAAGCALGVASYKNSTWQVASSVLVESSLATQRRRQSR